VNAARRSGGGKLTLTDSSVVGTDPDALGDSPTDGSTTQDQENGETQTEQTPSPEASGSTTLSEKQQENNNNISQISDLAKKMSTNDNTKGIPQITDYVAACANGQGLCERAQAKLAKERFKDLVSDPAKAKTAWTSLGYEENLEFLEATQISIKDMDFDSFLQRNKRCFSSRASFCDTGSRPSESPSESDAPVASPTKENQK
jgi:hypothetical protein